MAGRVQSLVRELRSPSAMWCGQRIRGDKGEMRTVKEDLRIQGAGLLGEALHDLFEVTL